VDDEQYPLEELNNLLKEICPDSEISAFRSPRMALEASAETTYDIAFLDIELGTTNGILLAKQLKDIQPNIHIIFVTSYSEYAVDAFAIHATGYLLKPVQKSHIERELKFLYGEEMSPHKRVEIKTFGGFSVMVDGKELLFNRQKSKELLAYLVERRGMSVGIQTACGILFEDKPYDRNMKNYFHTILADLKTSLTEAGVEDILIKSYNSIAIDPEKIDCDYYRFLDGDAKAVNDYHGEFLPAYSWAEFVNGNLTS